MQPIFIQIDLQWRELLVRYPNTNLEIEFGNTRYFDVTLSGMERSSLKYFEHYKSNFQTRYFDIEYGSQVDYFKNGPNEINIKHEDCIYKVYGLIGERIRYEDYINGTKTEIFIPTESKISWTEFYEKIKNGEFKFGNKLETFDLIIYLIGRVKYAVYLHDLETDFTFQGNSGNNIEKSISSEINFNKGRSEKKLKVNQIALIYAYNGNLITRQNAQKIAELYGYKSKTSGEGLFQDFIYYGSPANRKAKPNQCTSKKLKNKIMLLESIINHLSIQARKRAEDEIKILKTLFESEYQ